MHDMTHSGGVMHGCYVTHMKETCHVTHMACDVYEWEMSNIWMIHISHMNRACLTDKWVMSRIWISPTSLLSCPRHALFIWDMSHSCDIESYFVGFRKCIHVYKHTYTYTRARKWCRGQLSTCQHLHARVYVCMCLYTFAGADEISRNITWMSHVSNERVLPVMNESCRIWTSHVSYTEADETAAKLKVLEDLKWVKVCCSVLQCVAACCSALQCVAVHRIVLQCVDAVSRLKRVEVVILMDELCHKHELDTSHIFMGHASYECAMSHIWTRHVTLMNQAYHVYEAVGLLKCLKEHIHLYT